LSFVLISLFLWYKTLQDRKKIFLQKELDLSSLQQEKNAAQLKAIISSFNPHFINNSLHWAQSRYQEDSTMVSVIGRLSENIEHIFMKTKNGQASHTLREELRLVENYILIQKVRFNNSFEYIPPNDEIAAQFADIEIPLMQLQIHVENAIEHGLRNRVASTFVKVECKDDGDYLYFIISDDGIGRPIAEKINSQGTQSGVEMLNNVHKIFNLRNEYHIKQWYEDDYIGDHGTRLHIKIPKQYKYVI
jgi:sensor histidine kinase YesM